MNVCLSRDCWGRLELVDAAGDRHENVVLASLFPITDPEHWTSICDEGGREIVCIEDPEELPPESRDILRTELSQREFMPVIHRILRVSSNTEPCQWDCETDRGRVRFVLPSEENVRRLGDHGAAVIDSSGIRYFVPDIRRLDAKSRRVVEWYV